MKTRSISRDIKKLAALAGVEWRLRQQSTFLGFMWTLLNPAIMFAAMYLVFGHWIGSSQKQYALFLVIGIVEWNFFASATNYALTSLQRRSPLLKNYPVKPDLIVLSSLLSVYFSHLLELAALVSLVLLSGNHISSSWLWLVPLDLLYFLFAAGVGMILSCLFVFYMDLERIWGILLMAGFFLTPVFYPLSAVGGARQKLLELNPLTAAIESVRLVLYGGQPLPGAVIFLALCALPALLAGFAVLRFSRARIGDYI